VAEVRAPVREKANRIPWNTAVVSEPEAANWKTDCWALANEVLSIPHDNKA
jgi:hypothetical protein